MRTGSVMAIGALWCALPCVAVATVLMDCVSADGAYLVTVEMQASPPDSGGDGLGYLLLTTPDGRRDGAWAPLQGRVFDMRRHRIDLRARPRDAAPDDAHASAIGCEWDQVG